VTASGAGLAAGGGPRRILGNLDAEADLAGLATSWSPRPSLRRPAFSRAALLSLSGAATLLRAFARDGDRLWTPVPVDPRRLAEVPGLPVPQLESGPLRALPPAADLLAWAETPQALALRGAPPAPAAPAAIESPAERPPLHDLLWRLSPAAPEVVATVHHRAFGLAVAQGLGQALPGARMVDSPAALESHLGAWESRGSRAPGGWVVKAPLSGAGRSRHIERSLEPTLSAEARQRVRRLLSLHGPLLFEPWMERLEDLGCAVLLLPTETWLAGFHRQFVDPDGRFRGVELAAESAGIDRPDDFTARLLLATAVMHTGECLEQAGYRGPFGIDAFLHRLPDGSTALHPLCEVNARMTFGLVARTLVDRLREPLGIAKTARVRLLFGRQVPRQDAVPLLLPGTEAGCGAAWLEIVG